MTNQATIAVFAAKASTNAAKAIYAAQHKRIWGRHAALRYIQKRYVPIGLYRLACQCEAVRLLEAT